MTTPALSALCAKLRKRTLPKFVGDSSKFIGIRRDEVPDKLCIKAADLIERLRSSPAPVDRQSEGEVIAATIERCAKIADKERNTLRQNASDAAKCAEDAHPIEALELRRRATRDRISAECADRISQSIRALTP